MELIATQRPPVTMMHRKRSCLRLLSLLPLQMLLQMPISSSSPMSTPASSLATKIAKVEGAPSSSIPLPLHLRDREFPTNVTLRGAVLHSKPFAIVERNEETGELTVEGLQRDLLDRLQLFAQEDGVNLTFQLDPWEYSHNHTYSTAVELVANDCDDTTLGIDNYTCGSLDFVVADLWRTADRFLRVDMTPPWMSNAISAMKYVGIETSDSDSITTLTQAQQARATVCVLQGTHSSDVVMDKFPPERGTRYLECSTNEECFQHLQDGDCVLYSRDELFLKAKEYENPSFQVTRERFNAQYVVWPLRYDLDPTVSYLIKRWITLAVDTQFMDSLYYKYFEAQLCAVGTAGPKCDLPCDPEHGVSDSFGRCVCESTKWVGDDCSIEVLEDYNLIPTSLKVIAYCLFAINVITILFCGAWLIRYRQSDQVRASQPFFLLLVLLGCFISSSTILTLAHEDDTTGVACMAIPWLYSLGFCITFGTLFAKIRRVYMVFQQASSMGATHSKSATARSCFTSSFTGSGRSATFVSFQETLLVIGAVTLVDVAVLLAWTLFDPLHWERHVMVADKFGDALESEGYCTCDYWEVFAALIGMLHLLLMAVACYLCFKARKIPTMFQEGKYVGVAMLSNLQIFVVGVPILIIVGSDPKSAFFVRSVMVWMNDLAVVVLLFGNLMFKTHRRTPVKISDDLVKKGISKAFSGFSQLKGDRSTIGGASSFPPSPMITSLNAPQGGIAASMLNLEEGEVEDDTENHDVEAPRISVPANVDRPFMMSSLSMDSEHENRKDKVEPTGGGKEPLSSLSLMSALSSAKKSSTRSVTFGMAYYSEGNDDGSELAVPIGALIEEDRQLDLSRRLSVDSAARFSIDSIQPKPPKPPRRGSFTLAADENEPEDMDDMPWLHNSSHQQELNKAPQLPTRIESEHGIESTGEPPHPSLPSHDNSAKSPQRPERICSAVEPLDESTPESALTCRQLLRESHANQSEPPKMPGRAYSARELVEVEHQPVSRSFQYRPPQKPGRMVSATELDNQSEVCDNTEDDNGPPQRPERLPSECAMDLDSSVESSDDDKEEGDNAR